MQTFKPELTLVESPDGRRVAFGYSELLGARVLAEQYVMGEGIGFPIEKGQVGWFPRSEEVTVNDVMSMIRGNVIGINRVAVFTLAKELGLVREDKGMFYLVETNEQVSRHWSVKAGERSL